MPRRPLFYLLITLLLAPRAGFAQSPGEAPIDPDVTIEVLPETSDSPTTESAILSPGVKQTSRDSMPLGPRKKEDAPREHRQRLWDRIPSGTLKTLGALAIVLPLLFLLRSFARRVGGPLTGGRSPSGVLEILGRFPFARGQSLILLKLDRRVLLLCQTAQGAQTLTELTDPDDVASLLHAVHEHDGSSFNARMEELLQTEGRPPQATPAREGQSVATPTVRGEIIDLTRATPRASKQEVGV